MYGTAENTALATTETTMAAQFELPTSVENEFSAEDLIEDAAGMQLNFPRVKIPAGGGLAFEIPSADSTNPEITQKLKGIILYHHPMNAYWPNGRDDEENAPPSCTSLDGVRGVGTPGVHCKECHFNQWGSGGEGNGKACKNGFSLYLLRSGEFVPLLISLPPTSIKPYSNFVTSFTSRRRGVYGSLVEIGLQKSKTPGGIEYSVATFSLIEDFHGEALKEVIAYAKGFRSQIKAMNEQNSAMEHQYSDAETAHAGYGGSNVTPLPNSEFMPLDDNVEDPF